MIQSTTTAAPSQQSNSMSQVTAQNNNTNGEDGTEISDFKTSNVGEDGSVRPGDEGQKPYEEQEIQDLRNEYVRDINNVYCKKI